MIRNDHTGKYNPPRLCKQVQHRGTDWMENMGIAETELNAVKGLKILLIRLKKYYLPLSMIQIIELILMQTL